MDNKIIEIEDLIFDLTKADHYYYNGLGSTLTDAQYDAKLNRLYELERETGYIKSNSPTQKVGAVVLDKIAKVNITDKPMLSLEKCHSEEEVIAFAGSHSIVGMIKCDGLSVRLIYENGVLVSANTRGNGYVGSDITEHVKNFINVPLGITKKERYVIDGEAIIKIHHFDNLNKDGEFSNPRNTAAGTLNLLDMKEVRRRKLSFIAWDVISGDDSKWLTQKLDNAQNLGFEIVYYSHMDTNENIMWEAEIRGIPYDGVVWKYNDVAYGNSLGATSHHYNNGIAWKPAIEAHETELLDIEWTMGRTGVLTPVAIVKEIEIDGAKINRASLHNLNVMEQLLGTPYKNQKVQIYKANEIIPQILSAEEPSGTDIEYIENIDKCPLCGGSVYPIDSGTSRFLMCSNPDCEGKLINKIDHFCGKKGLDIKHLSKATLEKLIELGWVNKSSDLYRLKDHRSEWINQPGFGVRSVDRILQSIEDSKNTSLESFICSLGIPMIGRTASKDILPYITSYEDFRDKATSHWDFSIIEGIGWEKCNAIWYYDYSDANDIYSFMNNITKDEPETASQTLEGKVICITGKLVAYKNRSELTSIIEAHGGKVTSSVSKNTSYLINNDNTSTSSKNLSAQKLGIPILTEEEFGNQFLKN